eukprot:2594570-Rhodomonas_salina.1
MILCGGLLAAYAILLGHAPTIFWGTIGVICTDPLTWYCRSYQATSSITYALCTRATSTAGMILCYAPMLY